LGKSFGNDENDIDICKSGKSERDQAIFESHEAVELNPNYAEAYTNRGGGVGTGRQTVTLKCADCK
jgi:hypothetical protein